MKLGKKQALLLYRANKREYAILEDFTTIWGISKDRALAKIELFIFEGLLEEKPESKYPIKYPITEKGKRILHEYQEAHQ